MARAAPSVSPGKDWGDEPRTCRSVVPAECQYTRSRGMGRVHGGAAQSARREGTMNGAEVVTVQHLVKRYGRLLAANDVSLSIREGEIFGIIGPNGAGKTTCVECISGLRAPDSGSISVYGL